MAITNHLIVSFDREKLNNEFDFYMITTSDKFISSGAYILDKPIDILKAESVVFDSGRSYFVMFTKRKITRLQLIESLADEKISIKQVSVFELKDYLLFRLLLNSLNNFESDVLKFNNVTGKLLIVRPEWINKKRDRFRALNISIDNNMNIKAEAMGFTKLSLFTNAKSLKDYPKYTFSDKNNSLKRCLHFEDGEVFIRKSLFNNKVEIPFFNFSKKDIKNNKVYYIYKVVELLEKRYNDSLKIEFETVDIEKIIDKFRDKNFIDKAYAAFNTKNANLVSFVDGNEFIDEFNDLCNVFAAKFGLFVSSAKQIDSISNNIVYIHNKEYYEDNRYEDPYKSFNRNNVIQCITVEDSADKIISDNEAIFDSIIKEVVIKDDILNKKRFSLDNWESFGFKNDWIFGKEKEGKHYFIIVKPNGEFSFKAKLNDFASFGDEILDKCSDYLTDNRGKEKVVVSDSFGNINVISRTANYMLPSKELFEMAEISRSKDSRINYFSGVIDINYYNINDEFYYNAGIMGSGMNTAIPKASLLYKCDIIEGNNIIPFILETMSASFVKYKSYTVLPYPIKYLNEYILTCL